MSTLTLYAGTSSSIDIECQRAGELQPTEIGSVTRAFNGPDRTSVRAVQKNYGALAAWLPTVTKDAIINGLKRGAQVPCTGDLFGNIQTLCTVRYTASTMEVGGGVVMWEVALVLTEVNPNNVLLRYSPGDSITGEVFTGPAGRRYYDASGVVQTAGLNVKRDSHYIGGIRSLLLEASRQNVCLQSEVLGTTWTLGNVTIGSNLVNSPDTAVTGDKIQEDNTTNVHRVYQPITTASVAQTFSTWVRAGERTKCVVAMNDLTTGEASIGVDLSNGTTFATGLAVGSWTAISARVETGFTNGFYRVSITGTRGAGTQTAVEVYCYTNAISYLGTTGSGVYAWGAQLEIGAFSTSYIPTTTVAVTRGAESYSLPFTIPPQEMTAYEKFVESGTISGVGLRLCEIASAADADPRFILNSTGSFYQAFHGNGVASVSSVLGATPAIGQVDEVTGRLFGDGSVDVSQSIAAAGVTSGAQSSANPFVSGSPWSGLLCWLNSGGSTNPGFVAIQSFKIVAGMRSLDEMRAA